MDEVTQKVLDQAFPHGVTVAQEGEALNFKMVGLEVTEAEGKPVILGWAYPNKDIEFYPEDIMVREDGDWNFNSGGKLFRFSPLTAAEEKAEKSMMAEV